jgi:hypothetical protein
VLSMVHKFTEKWRPITALALIISVIGAIALVQSGGAHTSGDSSISDPGFSFTADVQGANDQPNQKDLTAHATYLTLTDLYVGWKWDDTGLSGTNTGDACALFTTDSNGNVDGALCVTIAGAAATWQSTRVYTCGDTKNDRCTSPIAQVPNIGSKCSVSDHATATFGSGTDTQATCKVALADFQGTVSNTTMLNTCSYPSQQPNSAPNDCVLIPGVLPTGAIQITKTGDDVDCTGPQTPTANCQSAGVSVLSGAHFEIKDPAGNVVTGAGDLVTGSDGKVCFAGLTVNSSAYTVNEKTAPSGYSIDDTDGKSVSVTSSGDCTSGAATVGFSDSPLSKFRVTFTAPAEGVTEAQISCDVPADTENGDPDDTTPVRDDTDETYSDLPAGTYTCTIDIAP